MRVFCLLIVCVLLFSHHDVIISGFEYPCTYKSKAGDFYDLSPLSKCDFSGYEVDEYVLNICNTVSSCNSRSAICQSEGYSSGSADSITYSDYSGKGLIQTYNNGDGGGCSQNRKAIVTFICNQNLASDPDVEFTSENPQCVYNFKIQSKYACPVPEATQKQICPINVFLLPHTHDDVGWLQTIDGYYQNQVKHILDTVVSSLAANPLRKFIYVEQAFFTRWWYDTKTSDDQRNTLRRLITNKQFEFVIGGWTMQDEACTTYGSDIDQMTQGHQFLLNTFGVTPSKGWQIDPFGASSVTPTLNKLSGFDAHLIDRVTNKGIYQDSQRLQFNWQGSPSLGKKSEIFTEIMGGGSAAYCDWLGSFNFENDPVNSGNVASYAKTFYSMVNDRARHYLTPNLLAAWGCDFAFQNATAMFHSMDILVDYMQKDVANSHVIVNYATLNQYYDAVWASAKSEDVMWPENDGGDFFVYDASLWWSGYFTSRVELKGVVRRGEAISKVVEPLYSVGRTLYKVNNTGLFDKLTTLRVANADATHHDGVTGTSEPPVVEMYKNDLLGGISNSLDVSSSILNLLLTNGTATQPALGSTVNLLNLANGQTGVVVLFNPLGWSRDEYFTVPINRNDVSVVDSKQMAVPFQINPANGEETKTSKYKLFFQPHLAGLGYSTYYVTAPKMAEENVIATSKTYTLTEDTVMETDDLSFSVGSEGVYNIKNKKTGFALDFQQSILQYTSEHSGAYAFGPRGGAVPLSTNKSLITVTAGPYVSEIYQVFPCDGVSTSYAKQTTRVYTSNGKDNVGNFIEYSFELGPLPSHKELVTSFQTPIDNGGVFATDDNGFEFNERVFSWSTGIEGNYFPIIYATYIKDDTSQFSVISERAHGTSSLRDGQLEVMVHRNPDMGDGFGPGLTDTTLVTPSLRVIADAPVASKAQIHRQTYQFNFPVVGFSAVVATPGDWSSKHNVAGMLLTADLPDNVLLLSVNALDATSNKVVIRLTHVFAIHEDTKWSQPAMVDLGTLFTNVKVSNVMETTLTANKVIDKPTSTKITINPKDIRTFIVEFSM